MERKFLLKLHKLFFLVGWVNLVGALGAVGMALHDFILGPTSDKSVLRFYPQSNFVFLEQTSSLFSYSGIMFFAFLIGSVFKMLAHKKPMDLERAHRFQKLCCGSYLLQSIFIILHCFDKIPSIYSYNTCAKFECGAKLALLLNGSYLINVVNDTVPPLLFASSIYVLFNHFSKMISFEAEVA